MHGLAVSVGDLVGVHRGLSERVEDGGDLEPALRPEVGADPVLGDRTDPFHPGETARRVCGASREVDEQPDRGQQAGLVERHLAAGVSCSPGLESARAPRARWTGLAGVGIAVAVPAAVAPPSAGHDDITGTVGLSRDCDGGGRCLARVTVQLQPSDAADDAVWFYALSWQGRGPRADAVDPPVDPAAGAPGIMRVALEPTGTPGEYRTAEELPMYGHWKSMLRLHLAPATMVVLPLHAPDDPAIAGPRGREVLVHDGDTVPLVGEKRFLQRETRDDVPSWLSRAGYGLVIASWLGLLLFFGWSYRYAARPAATAVERPREPALA